MGGVLHLHLWSTSKPMGVLVALLRSIRERYDGLLNSDEAAAQAVPRQKPHHQGSICPMFQIASHNGLDLKIPSGASEQC